MIDEADQSKVLDVKPTSISRLVLLEWLGVDPLEDLTDEAMSRLEPHINDPIYITDPDAAEKRFPVKEEDLLRITGWQNDYGKLALRCIRDKPKRKHSPTRDNPCPTCWFDGSYSTDD